MPPFGVDHTKKLLPDVLPSGDPTRFALPIFLKEPSDTFLIKSKPATLHCRVAHALRVFFQCNSENVEPSQKEDHVEPESGVRYTEASVDIDREQVEEYFSEFHCACVAISGKGSVVSRHALVTNACKLRLCLRTPTIHFGYRKVTKTFHVWKNCSVKWLWCNPKTQHADLKPDLHAILWALKRFYYTLVVLLLYEFYFLKHFFLAALTINLYLLKTRPCVNKIAVKWLGWTKGKHQYGALWSGREVFFSFYDSCCCVYLIQYFTTPRKLVWEYHWDYY